MYPLFPKSHFPSFFKCFPDFRPQEENSMGRRRLQICFCFCYLNLKIQICFYCLNYFWYLSIHLKRIIVVAPVVFLWFSIQVSLLLHQKKLFYYIKMWRLIYVQTTPSIFRSKLKDLWKMISKLFLALLPMIYRSNLD